MEFLELGRPPCIVLGRLLIDGFFWIRMKK